MFWKVGVEGVGEDIKQPIRKKALIIISLIVAMLATAWFALFCHAPNIDSAWQEDSIKILFVGNSHVYTGNVPKQIKTLAKNYGINTSYTDISRNGATLSNSKEEAIREMQAKKYDYVVLQDQTMRPHNDNAGFLRDVQELSDEARKNGATPVLYNPAWANNDGIPDQERQSVSTEAYKKAADEYNVVLVNAGEAWGYVYESMPGISLYAWDKQHANEAGAYLTSCVFVATLFDLHITDNITGNLYKGDNAIDIAQAVWEFVHLSQR